MDIQEKLADLLTWHVAVRYAFEKEDKSEELELQIKFITTITQTRIELMQLRQEVVDLKLTIKMMGDDASE